MAARNAASRTRGQSWSLDLLAVTTTILLTNTPTLFAFYVILDTHDPSTGVSLVRYATTTMSGALVFALLWTGIVLAMFGPSISAARMSR